MKFTKKLLAGSVAAATVAAAAFAPVANAEVSASVGVASSYLWRGIDLGQGTPAVSGDINFSAGGFYTGTWVSSGDSTGGTEYDLYAGYGGEAGIFNYDVSLWTYVYPQGGMVNGKANQEDTAGDLSELIVTVGVGAFSASVYENVATTKDESYRYYTLSATTGALSYKIGHHNTDPDDVSEDSMTHVDITYSHTDNLSFTLSQVIKDQDNTFDDDLNVVVSYNLPL